MSWARALIVVSLAAAGCGDNIRATDPDAPQMRSPSASSSVGGSQVSHSKSFMLVTSVATGHAQIAKSTSFINKPGVGGER